VNGIRTSEIQNRNCCALWSLTRTTTFYAVCVLWLERLRISTNMAHRSAQTAKNSIFLITIIFKTLPQEP